MTDKKPIGKAKEISFAGVSYPVSDEPPESLPGKWENNPHLIPFRAKSKLIELSHLSAKDIDPNDIAFTLARTFRFNGATDKLYSVAQHSVMCSTVAPDEHKLGALLHDAHEYITGDIPGPVQELITATNHHFFDVIGDLKLTIDYLIEDRFDCEGALHNDYIKEIDKRMLAAEMLYLFGENYTDYEPYLGLNDTWTPEKSEKMFLETLRRLTSDDKKTSNK